jgi:hypothetical protein
MGIGDCSFSIVIELIVGLDDWIFLVIGTDNNSLSISIGENERLDFVLDSTIEIYQRNYFLFSLKV